MRRTLVILLLTLPALAVEEYYSIARSVRALGMGNAFYGNSDDEYALFYNPTGFGLYKGKGHFNVSLRGETNPITITAASQVMASSGLNGMVQTLSNYSGTPLTGGLGIMPYFISKNFGLAVLLAETKLNVMILGRDVDSTCDVTALADNGLVVGFGTEITSGFRIGFNLKALYRFGGYKQMTMLELAQGLDMSGLIQSGGGGLGLDADLGLTYDFPPLPFGVENRLSVVFNNLAATTFPLVPIQTTPPGLARTVSFGTHTAFRGIGPIDNFHFRMDFAEFSLGGQSDADRGARGGSLLKHVNVGLEIPFKGSVVLRGGVHQGNLTWGLGFHLGAIKLEFASYGEELFSGIDRLTSQRYAFRLVFGAGTPAPARVPSDETEAALEAQKKNEEQTGKKEEKKPGQNATGKDGAVRSPDSIRGPSGPVEVDRYGIDRFIEESWY